MADEPDTTTNEGVPAFVPLSTYENFDHFWPRLVKSSSKSPSILALQSLTHSKPELAKTIFERAVMEPFTRLLQTEWPHANELSVEAAKRVADLCDRFLQEPVLVLLQLEGIFVIELVDPHARILVRDLSLGKSTLEKVRSGENRNFANKIEATSAAYAQINLIRYVRERENRIMLELVRAIDGRTVEQQALEVLETMPSLQANWEAYGRGSLIGEEGARKAAAWVFGYVEF